MFRDAFRLYYRTYRTSDWVIAVGCLSDPLRRRVNDLLELGDHRFDEDAFDHDDTDNAPYYRELMVQLWPALMTSQLRTPTVWTIPGATGARTDSPPGPKRIRIPSGEPGASGFS